MYDEPRHLEGLWLVWLDDDDCHDDLEGLYGVGFDRRTAKTPLGVYLLLLWM